MPTTPPNRSWMVCRPTRRQAAAQPPADGKDGYKLTPQDAVLSAGDAVRPRSALRERLYRAYTTRASDQAEGDATRLTMAR